MKRAACIILTVMMVCIVACAHATNTTEDYAGKFADVAKQVRTASVSMLKVYKDYYDKGGEISDAQLVAIYSYYKLYRASGDVYIAESSMSLGKIGEALIEKSVLRTSSNSDIIIESKWNEWLAGKYGKDEMVELLMIFIDGIVKAGI